MNYFQWPNKQNFQSERILQENYVQSSIFINNETEADRGSAAASALLGEPVAQLELRPKPHPPIPPFFSVVASDSVASSFPFSEFLVEPNCGKLTYFCIHESF